MDGLRNGQVPSPAAARSTMDVSSTVAGFVHRYQSLSLHRDSLDNLIKVSLTPYFTNDVASPCLTLPFQDLIVYSESIESSLREENATLLSKLRDTELDLEDATRSRRDLQQQVQQLQVYREAVLQDNNYLKVAPPPESPGHCSSLLQNNNPYVIVLIDGDGLLVSWVLGLRSTSPFS
jgi:hypothetical protein